MIHLGILHSYITDHRCFIPVSGLWFVLMFANSQDATEPQTTDHGDQVLIVYITDALNTVLTTLLLHAVQHVFTPEYSACPQLFLDAKKLVILGESLAPRDRATLNLT